MDEATIPVDAVTASGSGLNSDISPANAALQVGRAAQAQNVPAAMIIPIVTQHTEGQINKLKLVKRSMYGRGKFNLLQQRLLHAA